MNPTEILILEKKIKFFFRIFLFGYCVVSVRRVDVVMCMHAVRIKNNTLDLGF